jgi:group II intron reverse transcriptase/maturase
MQNAETVLGVLKNRGRRRLPVDELYRQLFNPALYLLAYGRIYANKGALTPGVDEQTADGMSVSVITRIIEDMRQERYRFTPVRRVHIPKKKGGTRPLGIPSWSDKLVQEVVRLLLEAYYEPQFSDQSHGFRPGRGCHTALREVSRCWTGTVWFIEGDIADCFGSLDHQVLLGILAEQIGDRRFLRVIAGMLKAGYLENFTWHATLSGAPQGAGCSPVLSNIYLDRLDRFVTEHLIPAHTRGRRRRRSPEYSRALRQRYRSWRQGDRPAAKAALRRVHALRPGDPMDQGYCRLRYVRYADDHLLGFIGPKAEAEQIKQQIAGFLRDQLKLELSQPKTLITHAATTPARFLGYEIAVQHNDRKMTHRRRSINGSVALRVPPDVIETACRPYLHGPRPRRVNALVPEDDYTIVAAFGMRYRGIVQYYLLARNVYWLNRLHWVMQTSMLRTLATKHRSTVTKMKTKHRVVIPTEAGKRTAYQARLERGNRKPLVATFGGIPLIPDLSTEIDDQIRPLSAHPHKELVARLIKAQCEICTRHGEVEVHHVVSLKHIAADPAPWARLMTRRRRKTLILCPDCHQHTHTR